MSTIPTDAAGREPEDASEPETAAPSGVTAAVVTGFTWKTITAVVSEGTRVLLVIVLARLLAPSDYGLAGMAFVVAGFVGLFTDLALGGALVQRASVTEEDVSTVFWFSVAVSLLMFVVTAALSPFAASFFHEPQVAPLIVVLALSFPLAALSTTQVALLTRRLAYRSLEIREIAGVLAGAVVGLTFALVGFGAYAIVGNTVAAAAMSTLLLWRFSGWRPSLRFSRPSLMKLGGFGIKLFGIRLLTYGNRNADNMLIGKFAGATALGVYSVAYNVMFTPVNRISMPLWGVVYPALVRMQDDLPRMRAAWLRSKRLSNALHSPVFFTILVVAPDLVAVIFGPKWSAAVPVVQLLCIAGLAHSVQNLNAAVVQARGNVGLVLRLQVFASIVTLAAFALGVHWGATGVAALYAVARWIIVPVDTWFTTRAVGFSFSEALFAGGSLLPVAAAAAGVAYLCRVGLVDAGVAPIFRLVAVGGVSLLLYGALVFVIAPGLVRDLREILQRRRAGVLANA